MIGMAAMCLAHILTSIGRVGADGLEMVQLRQNPAEWLDGPIILIKGSNVSPMMGLQDMVVFHTF